MMPELLEQQQHFNAAMPRMIEAYSLVPTSDSSSSPTTDESVLSPLLGQLQTLIQNQLPTLDVTKVESHDSIARVTAECSQRIQQCQDDVRRFLQAICYQVVQIQVRGEHHPESMAAALEKTRRPLLTAIKRVVVPLEQVLTAELIVQPLPVVCRVVQQWLHDSSRAVANQLIVALHNLVEMEVVGIIEWRSEDVCKLHFFQHTIIQDRIRSQNGTTVRRVQRNTLSIEEWERFRARNRIGIERHEHHVRKAETRELGQTSFPIPQEYNELIGRIPSWMRPQVRVLEGDLFLERIVRRQLREEEWESEPKVRNAYEIEPALLLGHFVLAGWGQHEIERETHRRVREQSVAAELQTEADGKPTPAEFQESSKLQTMSRAAAVTAIVMMLFSPLQHRVMLPLSLALSAVAVIVLGRSLSLRSRGVDQDASSLAIAGQCSTQAFGLLAIQSALFGVLFGSWSMFGLAIPLTIVWALIRNLSQSRQQV